VGFAHRHVWTSVKPGRPLRVNSSRSDLRGRHSNLAEFSTVASTHAQRINLHPIDWREHRGHTLAAATYLQTAFYQLARFNTPGIGSVVAHDVEKIGDLRVLPFRISGQARTASSLGQGCEGLTTSAIVPRPY